MSVLRPVLQKRVIGYSRINIMKRLLNLYYKWGTGQPIIYYIWKGHHIYITNEVLDSLLFNMKKSSETKHMKDPLDRLCENISTRVCRQWVMCCRWNSVYPVPYMHCEISKQIAAICCYLKLVTNFIPNDHWVNNGLPGEELPYGQLSNA